MIELSGNTGLGRDALTTDRRRTAARKTRAGPFPKPRHILLKPAEAAEVLERYHIKPFQIPYIKSTDPAVRAIGAKPGDIVKVVRRSATAGESDFYRYVVEDF